MNIECAFFGVLGRDGKSKLSKSGKAYLRLGIRVGDGDGAQWVNTMAFDEKAIERAAEFIKGAAVYVEGSLKLDKWTGQDGAERHGLSCMSWHCRLSAIGKNKERRAPPPPDNSKPIGEHLDDEIPF
jgi:single-stranded DNA-binding protein